MDSNVRIPCYLAVVTYADDRLLREEMYKAYITRASDEGPLAGQFDNTAIMSEILALRHEKANLSGFEHYAQRSLATKMAESSQSVLTFLSDLGLRARAQALKDLEKLRDFAQGLQGHIVLEPWDIAYFSEKQLQALYSISQEELRAFFPLDKVMDGLFSDYYSLIRDAL